MLYLTHAVIISNNNICLVEDTKLTQPLNLGVDYNLKFRLTHFY